MQLSDFDYHLPQAQIAQYPARERGTSRLLCVFQTGLQDSLFDQLPRFLQAGDVLVFNDSKVLKARLFGKKSSGGKIEALIERITGPYHAWAQLRFSKAPLPGTRLIFANHWEATVVDQCKDLFHLHVQNGRSVYDLLDDIGHLPLPPYIRRPADFEDAARYQTVYARPPGSVAAPTAGLHFSNTMLQTLRKQGIITAFLTLHIGAGTFQPIRTTDISEHRIHNEHYHIPIATVNTLQAARKKQRRIIAVGTSTLRALEAASQSEYLRLRDGSTNLFITPGYRFRVADYLFTNFHLPKSSLLILVAAFSGLATIQSAYTHAVRHGYQFFSYGDAMLLERADLLSSFH